MKVLNLYAGIGGNRKLWENVEVTAIENNKEIAKIYQNFFPQDKVIVTDAHQYLLEHFQDFDFIWSSPPCQTHSRSRFGGSFSERFKPVYPDMKLYEEILFLKHYYKGKWIVENIRGYYEPVIRPMFQEDRHIFWCNFIIIRKKMNHISVDSISPKKERYGFDLKGININHRKDQILKNLVNPKLGLHVFNCAFREKQRTLGEVK